jgi:uncharacterized damage-inducible protein DinB
VSPAYASVVRSSEIQALVGYLYWLRDRVLTAADQAGVEAFRAVRPGASRDLRATLVHELDVETSWRRRLMGADETDLDPADYPTLDAIADDWRRDEAEMRRWLASLTDEELASPPPHETNPSFPLWYYLVHTVSHGIQELEEAVVLLGPSGHAPTDLGFLDYADSTRIELDERTRR